MRSLLVAPLLLTACLQANQGPPVQGNNGGSCANCGRKGSSSGTGGSSEGGSSRTTTAAASSGGSTSGGASSSSGPTGGSSSGGGSTASSAGASLPGEYICPNSAVPPLTANCPNGGALPCQVIDLVNCAPIAGATLSAIGADGVPIAGASAVSDANGAFVFCTPFETAFTIQAKAPGYLNTNLAEILVALDGGTAPDVGQIGLLDSEFIMALSAFVPGGYDTTKGMAVAAVGGTGACVTADAGAGWTLSIGVPDGGALPSSSYTLIYLASSELPAFSATATTSAGTALFVNVDLPADDFVEVGAANPNAGICPLLNSSIGFTGRLLLGPNTGSFAPFVLP